MNGVGDRCKAVLLLVSGPNALETGDVERSRGYHCACSLLTSGVCDPSADQLTAMVKQSIQSFCVDSKLSVSFKDSPCAKSEVLGSPGAFALRARPLTVMECAAEDLPPLRAQLLSVGCVEGQPFDDKVSPYCLLTVLDLTHHREMPAADSSAATDPFSWVRPTQSDVSEYRSNRCAADAIASGARRMLFPAHMYCSLPMVRDTGLPTEGGLLDGYNTCTLEGILRELGYKAGLLPKYGA